MKLIFMGLQHIAKKWTMPIRDWGAALSQFAIIYGEDRVPL
jgi:transposase-like protein